MNPNQFSEVPSKDYLVESDFSVQVKYAGFWLRFAAYLIDSIALVFIFGVILFGFSVSADLSNSNNEDTLPTQMIFVSLFFYIGSFLYFPIMESSKMQATLGKKALNLQVTDADGNRITFLNALGRTAAKILSAVILYIGFIMVGFTQKKQGLHDIIASTLVVKVE